MPTLTPSAEALLTYIRQRDNVTYIEVERILAPLMPVKGIAAITSPDIENLVWWAGVSRGVVTTVQELFSADLIWRAPASWWRYLRQGRVLRCPIPRHYQPRYATPHWVPTVLRATEYDSTAQYRRPVGQEETHG